MLTPLPPPPPRDLGPRLQRLGAQAAAIVLLGLFSFGLVGLFVDDEGGGDSPAAAPSAVPPADPTLDAGEETPPSAAPSVDAPSPTAPTPTGDATTSAPATETGTPTATPASSVGDEGRVDPGSIRIQVLDGVLDDGRAAAESVAAELRAAGYNVVVVNQASRRYDRTTVFYVGGNDDAAAQVADEFGYPDVEPKPDNLSSSVDLHIVVGADQT